MPTPRLTIQLYDRAFQPVLVSDSLTLILQRYAKNVIGGPKDCEVLGLGNEAAIWDTVDWLRYTLVVADDTGEAVWWGYVSEVELAVGAFTFGVSLDSMANRVAVAYSLITPGQTTGERATTDWVQDDTSVAEYGTREALLTLGDVTAATAESYRDAALQIGKWPVPTIGRGTAGQLQATIHCRGWWSTLSWQLYTAGIEGAGYVYVVADGEFASSMEPGLGVTSWAQSFQMTGSSWRLESAQVRLQKVGSPGKDITLAICADSSGVPGTTLASATITASTIGSTMDWQSVDLSSANVTLSPSTTYWLTFTPSGSGTFDGSNCYNFGYANTVNGYASGSAKSYTSPTWTALTHDIFFLVGGVRETSTIFLDVLTTSGQFFAATSIRNASGVYGTSYADGDSDAQQVAEDLLAIGTTSSLRYNVQVLSDRSVVAYAEPNPSAIELYMDSDGQLSGIGGVMLKRHTCPFGVWAKLKDVIPATANTSAMADPSLVFIEEAEYDATTDTYTPAPRGMPTIWDLS